ncbi:probable WRKY transcription factor 2 isoform X1 [Typha latifolia]|uniref:probable WRKY transcription factor 2 isoform X1 n=1 Tax=Typha latifolia TaxID=4733 RepID=UPI003C2CBD5C
MDGRDDGVTMMEDWMFPNPSPRTLMSKFLSEEYGSRSFSDLLEKNGCEGLTHGSEKQKVIAGSEEEEGLSKDQNLFNGHKSNSHGGLAERMAARAGFNVPKLNMSSISSNNMVTSSSEVKSPYLTIPPGLSPTTLLDSPVFLSNRMAQPSPTTGTFLFSQSGCAKSMSEPVRNRDEDHSLEEVSEGFAFKPPLQSNSTYFSGAEKKGPSTVNHQQSLPSMGLSVQSENIVHTGQQSYQLNSPKQQGINPQVGFSDSSDRKDSADDTMLNQRMSDSFVDNNHSSPPVDQQDGEADSKGENLSLAVGAPAEDGYNWRKYGQKQVKHSEYPRSYYKCTHPNCQVKKKVERSHEGQITEIIYKGSHNHPKPPTNRRASVPSYHPVNNVQVDGSENPGSQVSSDVKSLWVATHHGTVQDSHDDGLEARPTVSIPTDFSDPSTSIQTQDGTCFESPNAIDASSTLSNDEDEDDRATHGSASLGCNGEGDESESKRRKLEACAIEMSAASRAVREPRVVVQTTSEVDILDDGYRWRKYGQKVVKGNPNPRSYYKCTNPGCSVRKHVERASHDLKSVITTYEGKHNHEVPAARNSSHQSSTSSTATIAAPQYHSHSIHRRLEPVQDSFVRLNGGVPLSALGLPPRDQLGAPSSFSFGMGQPCLMNLPMAGLVLPPPMHHTYLGHCQVTEAGFMMPKEEPREEPMLESGLPVLNGSSSVYQQMSRLPL